VRGLNFRVLTILALSVFVIVGYGCSEEEMIKPGVSTQSVWEATDGQIGGHVLSMAFNSNDDLYVLLVENSRALYYTRDNGRTWAMTDTVNVDTMLYTIRSFAFSSSDDLFIGSKEGLIFSSSDNGDSLAVVDTLGVGLFVDVRGIVAGENNFLFAAVSGSGIYRSEDSGQNWINVGADLENKGFINNGLIINSEEDIYSASWGGDVYKGKVDGNSWDALELFTVGYFPLSINCLTFREDGNVIGGFDGFFCYYETDPAEVDSSMWVQHNYGLPEVFGQSVDVRCLEVDSNGAIYAGTYGNGVFRLLNQGSSWETVSAGLPDLEIQDIAIRSDNVVFAGTLSEGIFYSIW